MIVKVKKIKENAVVPKYAHPTDACFDLVATDINFDEENKVFIYGTGLAFEIPEGYVGLVYPRSSIYKQTLSQANCVGVIDSGYRGEVKVIYNVINKSDSPDKLYHVGDRIAQMMIIPIPTIELQETTDLSNSDRGEGGFGSTGTK